MTGPKPSEPGPASSKSQATEARMDRMLEREDVQWHQPKLATPKKGTQKKQEKKQEKKREFRSLPWGKSPPRLRDPENIDFEELIDAFAEFNATPPDCFSGRLVAAF